MTTKDINKKLNEIAVLIEELKEGLKEPITQTLTKDEAIAAMEQGKKVTHRYFTPNEYLTIVDGFLIDESKVTLDKDVFWSVREESDWLTDWSIVEE